MLGQELVRAFSSDQTYEVVAWDKDDLDITDFAKLEEKISELKPELLINAAAYNAVDLCETDEAEYARALMLIVMYQRHSLNCLKNMILSLSITPPTMSLMGLWRKTRPKRVVVGVVAAVLPRPEK